MSGNWNQRELIHKMAEGVRRPGGIPIEVHTLAINRGITIGPERKKTSLVSREIIADSVCPGAGARDGRFTASTMAAAYEVLGISAMGRNDIPASDPLKAEAALACGRFAIDLVDRRMTPRSLAMRRSFENAIAGVMATGGSTVPDLLATAQDSHCRSIITIASPGCDLARLRLEPQGMGYGRGLCTNELHYTARLGIEYRQRARRRLGVRAHRCHARRSAPVLLSSCRALLGVPCRIRLRHCPPPVTRRS
jgi:Dehydratase family